MWSAPLSCDEIQLECDEARREASEHLVHLQQDFLQDGRETSSTQNLPVHNARYDFKAVLCQQRLRTAKCILATVCVVHDAGILVLKPSERHLYSVLPEQQIGQYH